ncbi:MULTISPECIES: DUF4148 domain-containing protein [Paraburkholderia]|uniref:DUF4148 domain-containing protein n=1 Tax=Paraburkholderia TaxID=1822464 RepID=UPI00037569AE|nr:MULTISPECIES: DUF4148 domain-containing protein [Paraburkholderia]MDH6148545.1 hypothetical protein [Paraburkholderia sp. WSM4179]
MKNSPRTWPALPALILSLAGCAAGGISQSLPPLSAAQCRDPAALRNNAPPTPERSRSELAALRKAGYDPSPWFDPHYPEDLQAAQRQVDRWYQAECQQAEPD